jgi:ABC-type transport system substrate-binding protein
LAAPSPLITPLPHTSGLRWTFSLRRGIPFHKGFSELKADDVAFSCHRVLDAKTYGPMRSIVDIVKDIKALDEYTVRMTIERPGTAAPTARRRSKNTALL